MIWKVTLVLRQAHLDAPLCIVGSASEYRTVSLPETICDVLFQCVRFMRFVKEHVFLKVIHSFIHSFIPHAVLQQVHSLFFQSQFSTQCDLVLPFSMSSILSFR